VTGRGRLLFILDVSLVGLAALLGVQVYRAGWPPPDPEVTSVLASDGTPETLRPMLTAATPRPNAMPPVHPEPLADAGFDVIADQNLFSPTRREPQMEQPRVVAITRPGPADTLQPVRKEPYLYGIVLGAPGGARAYLREAATNKLSGYGIGDMVGGRVLEEIGPDRVILRETDGERVSVFLRDPAKPRPVARRLPVRAPRPMPRALR
jgi:hypothetical protein